MGDAVLACDYGAVFQAGGDVMAEVAVDGWDNVYVVGDSRDSSKQIDG